MYSLTPADIDARIQTGTTPFPVHLVGAGGCGMSALGHLLLDLGHPVSGSDLVLNEEVRGLRARGARINQGHDSGHLLAARPVLVVYSSAIPQDNPELVAAGQHGIPCVRRALLLSVLVHRQRGIGVAGMHGKTTTTALLAFALEQLGAQPSYAIGAPVPQLPRAARLVAPEAGTSHWFVAELDESDGSLKGFRPEQVIVLNVDEEHLDHFHNLEAICEEFRHFLSQARGRVVYCADDERLVQLCAGRPHAVSFGYDRRADYRAVRLEPGRERPEGLRSAANSWFEVWRGEERLGRFGLQLMGEKNISNATAVIGLLHQMGFEPTAIAAALQPFRGAARRQQELYRDETVRVFDDYGHHPREIHATLQALKELGPRRLLVAFQPHRFTRTRQLLNQFAGCFTLADRIWITEIYAASEPALPEVNGAALAAAIRNHGQSVEFIASLSAVVAAVRAVLQPGDCVLFLGAGNITEAAHEFVAQLHRAKTSAQDHFFAALTAGLSRDTILRRGEPMSKHTTWRVGGPADYYVEPASEAELTLVLHNCRAYQVPFHLLGRGSNVLVKEGGVRGVVICLAHPYFSRIEVQGNQLHCGAGAKLRAVAMEAKRQGLSGLEFMEGIPGSVGGALRMNAGAHGSSMFQVVERIRYMDFEGQAQECRREEVPVEYRHCPFFRNHIALGAVLRGEPAPIELIEQKLNTFNQRRWQTQPAAPSAGCVFKNPPTIPAGKLIEELGLKGTRIGDALVSDVHGNFLINTGHATAEDVLRLIKLIQTHARTARGIELETEVEIWGDEMRSAE